ncbi:condensin-2 complex subunit H2 isoform X6 [Gallus gallus]|uniref:condensin-2 complex subunit H2 isoform X6 n=1 Tax=Gallus gallus TaxID=9031 RepID=UPI001AE5FCDE|nr:condensin-2 complex subunit H2 isoform X6 [Gallus gallus]XP_040515833.1 condensin-2 complex subunit H2 isoform X6 [Gallus gallus]
MEDVESRFAHLLQPIRDLTKNWEVDVAAQLGEYLEELDQICISFDGGKTTMNFIEAALLIQGSACIYSKKVEYLYSLVYQALDSISNKKRERQPCSVGPDGKDADATFGMEKEEFLSLDDISNTSQASVDLKMDHQPNAVNVVPLTPMSLVPPEEAEKINNPLFSRKGEILASRKDFRMNTCTPHTSGAFMLELAGLSPTCLQDRHREENNATGAVGAQSSVIGGRESLRVSTGAMPVQALNFSDDGGAAGPDDDHDGGDDLPVDPENNMEVTPAANEHIEPQRSVPQVKGYVLRQRAPAEDLQPHIKEMLDPWQSLDPFGDSEDKPFRKGRPFLVPHGMDDVVGSKRKRKGPRKLQDFLKWFSATYNNSADCRKSRRKGPTFADLEVLYWKQQKERFAAQRKLQSRMVRMQAGLEDGGSHDGWGLSAAFPQGPPLSLPPEHEEEEEELDALEKERGEEDGEAADDFVEHEDIQEEDVENLVEKAMAPCDADALSYEELVRKNVELFIANSQRYVQETELSQHVRLWEEKMGPALQEQEERTAFDIHSYGDRLAARFGSLGEWQSFASLVAGQPPFEVCRYMLASLQLVSVGALGAGGAPGGGVFAAAPRPCSSPQANDYTVEVAQDPGLEEAVDTVRLRLLTRERAHERFRTYLAPSARQ